MELESARMVLSNEVNTITVCADRKRPSGVFYTVVSIVSPSIRRQTAGLMATSELFATNSDFVGSFTQGEALNLVFVYREENRLNTRESIYGTDFPHRRTIAEHFLVSCAAAQITGSVGLLLLNERNINLTPEGEVYFNYFLDFAEWKPQMGEEKFTMAAAQCAFDILTREYAVRYETDVSSYPSELQVFYKKIEARSFQSIGGILSFVRNLPDHPQEPRRGFWRILDRLSAIWSYLREHSMMIFIVILVAATLIFAVYQIAARVSANSAKKENTTYNGLSTIGEVYLGDEDV